MASIPRFLEEPKLRNNLTPKGCFSYGTAVSASICCPGALSLEPPFLDSEFLVPVLGDNPNFQQVVREVLMPHYDLTLPAPHPPLLKNEVIVHSFLIHSLQNCLLGTYHGNGTNVILKRKTKKNGKRKRRSKGGKTLKRLMASDINKMVE